MAQLQPSLLPRLSITHLIPLQKEKIESKGTKIIPIANVQILSNLLPLAFHSRGNYSAYYYYTEPCFYGIPFPYYIVFNHHILLLSADYQQAMLLTGESHHFFHTAFTKLLQTSFPLLPSLNAQTVFSVQDILTDGSQLLYAIEQSPCVLHCIDRDMLSNIILDSHAEKATAFDQAWKFFKKLASLSRSISAFCRKGLDSFVKKGVIQGLPSGIFRPFTPQERIILLERMIQENMDEKKSFLLIAEKTFRPCRLMNFYTTDENYSVFTYDNGRDIREVCTLREGTIAFAFRDFMENMVLHQLACTPEETNDAFRLAIEYLKEALLADID